MLDILRSFFHGKRVFLTGHTGFKGAWMTQVLHSLGATVKGFSLSPEKPIDLYHQIQGDDLCYSSVIGDIRDLRALQGEMVRFEPHFVFHFAAQALVRRSYSMPVDTFATNTLGTVHALESIRALPHDVVGIIITTDKVYENAERGIAFTEGDKLGGYDPYAASKAAAEIVIDSYRYSYFNHIQADGTYKAVASVRAGNVIGGGDYSDDRLIPDIVRAIEEGKRVMLRNPHAIRPWQHVLEPIGAYLLLAAKLRQSPDVYATAYNFGPDRSDERSVETLTRAFLQAYGLPVEYDIHAADQSLHEANLLMLDSTKAKSELGWSPRLNADEAISWTAAWYADKRRPARDKCQDQIDSYFKI